MCAVKGRTWTLGDRTRGLCLGWSWLKIGEMPGKLRVIEKNKQTQGGGAGDGWAGFFLAEGVLCIPEQRE